MTGTVLYIDDEEANIKLVERVLRRRPDIRLRAARNGRDGVESAVGDPPALILLDNRLPDSSGEQVLRQLAAAPATAAVPVIILTGDSAQTAEKLLAAGAAGYLLKPFDIHQLLEVIEKHLGLPIRA